MRSTVSIKGTREGLTVTLSEGEFDELLDELSQYLATQGAFFRGGTVALQVGERALSDEEFARFNALFAEHEMTLRTVVTSNTETRQAAQALGLRVVIQPATPEDESPQMAAPVGAAVTRPVETSKGILVRHLVRSGQVIRHTGHVVVVGDVNIGGEIVAGGDVIIWGRLHGTVHAGAFGNSQAIVCALELAPLQLRIGELIARSDERERPGTLFPEVARVRDNAIVVEPWDRVSRGA